MLTFSGALWEGEASKKFPSIDDIAIMQGKMCRYNGACKIFWPVLIHSMCVADLLPDEYKLYGLLHDAAEIIISDIPTPFKRTLRGIDEVEMGILNTMLNKGFGVPIPSAEAWEKVKEADERALYSECRLFGPDNIDKYLDLRKADFESDNIVNYYFLDYVKTKYDAYEGIFSPSGKYIQDFIHRFIEYRNALMGIESYVKGGDCFVVH